MKDVQSALHLPQVCEISWDTHEIAREYLTHLQVHILLNFLIIIVGPTWKFNIAFQRKMIGSVMLSLYFMWVNIVIFW